MSVAAPVSSMKTRRSGFSSLWLARHSSRAWATSELLGGSLLEREFEKLEPVPQARITGILQSTGVPPSRTPLVPQYLSKSIWQGRQGRNFLYWICATAELLAPILVDELNGAPSLEVVARDIVAED